MANERGSARIRTPKPLKVNVRANRVNKNKGSRYKRDKSLASQDKRTSAGHIRRGLSSAPMRSKRKIVDEHPLARAFTDSLSKTTSHISTKLPQKLSDKLEIALSQISAVTARSRMYLIDSLELKSKLFTSSPLLSGKFRKDVEGFQEMVREQSELLDDLWARWEECVNEIENLGIDEGVLGRGREEKGNSVLGNDPQQGGDKKCSDDANDDELDRLLQGIKAVGKIWTKRMEDSEKEIADKVLQQQQLAATVFL